MKYGLYINNKMVFSSTNRHDCMTKGVEVLTKEYNNHGANGATEVTANYLDIVCNFTYKAKNASGLDFYADCHFNDKYIEVKPILEKTYEITYKVSFEKDAVPNEDYFTMEYKVLCYEDKVDKIVNDLRKRLELNVENDLSVRGERFDDMLGKEVECLQDEDTAYDVFDTINKKYHLILVNEVYFD